MTGPKCKIIPKLLTQFKAYFAPNKAEKVISQVYRSNSVPHARDLQIAMFKNNTYCKKTLFKKKPVDSPLCISCGSGSEEDLYHRMWACLIVEVYGKLQTICSN